MKTILTLLAIAALSLVAYSNTPGDSLPGEVVHNTLAPGETPDAWDPDVQVAIGNTFAPCDDDITCNTQPSVASVQCVGQEGLTDEGCQHEDNTLTTREGCVGQEGVKGELAKLVGVKVNGGRLAARPSESSLQDTST